MARRTFSPRSIQQNERAITRFQDDFSGGMYGDIPASSIPENAVVELENFINYGNRLEGRGGCKEWSSTLLPNLSNRGPFSATKTGTTVSLTVGTVTEDDEGTYFYWSDTGTYERIEDYTNSTEFEVHTSSEHSGTVTDCYLRGQVNALYFHKSERKILLHIDERVFISDVDTISWSEVYPTSYRKPANGLSNFDEYKQYGILFNSNGIFKFDVTSTPLLMWKANSRGPQTRLSDGGSGDYKRRYIYSMSRFTGDGFDLDREDTGVVHEQETGTVVPNEHGIDYCVVSSTSGISSGNGHTVSGLTVPTDENTGVVQFHHTHYSVYSTLDVGSNGSDPISSERHNSSLYVWLMDIPVAKAMYGSKTGTTVTLSNGTVADHDIGSTFEFMDGTSGTIQSVTSSTVFEADTSGTVTTAPLALGGGDVLLASSTSSGTLTITSGYTLSSGDVGKPLFWDDGTIAWIKTSGGSITGTDVRSTRAVTLNPVSRNFYDNIPDYSDSSSSPQLAARISSYSLNNRFQINLRNGNVGKITPSFMFVASINDTEIKYCSLPLNGEQLLGYYVPEYQYLEVKDSITLMDEFQDKLVIFCKNSTHGIPLNTVSYVETPQVGELITVIAGQNIIDDKIGILDIGSYQKIADSNAMLLTSNLEHRAFDGEQYSENLAADRVMNTFRSWQAAVASSYDDINGYIVWGLNE